MRRGRKENIAETAIQIRQRPSSMTQSHLVGHPVVVDGQEGGSQEPGSPADCRMDLKVELDGLAEELRIAPMGDQVLTQLAGEAHKKALTPLHTAAH